MNELAVILKRMAELIENKMAVSKAMTQVANEIVALNTYCEKNRIVPKNITSDNLRKGKLK